MITDGSVHALEMGSQSSERVAPSMAMEQKRRIRIAMLAISAVSVAIACTILILETSTNEPAPVSGTELRAFERVWSVLCCSVCQVEFPPPHRWQGAFLQQQQRSRQGLVLLEGGSCRCWSMQTGSVLVGSEYRKNAVMLDGVARGC